jgi:methylated-DNA-[protein]-cysteine S-methyltransferase
MSKFSQKVINVVKKIPCGKILTYKEVAKRAGNPKACRAVGNILNSYYTQCLTRGLKIIPCHRVIRSDGKPGGYVLGKRKKKLLLRKEGYVK